MGTSLLTKQDLVQLPELYATESVAMENKVAWARLCHVNSGWVWYVIEFDGEDQCFGLVEGHDKEFGYFSLNELREVTGPYGLTVERDIHFAPTRIAELLK